jgi:6-phosphofructokinase 1
MDPNPTPPNPHGIRRVAILFAGGPAPAANAVISTAAVSFLRHGIEVVGVYNGYSKLVTFAPDAPLQKDRDYVLVDHKFLRRTRNSRGILIGTARTNPGKNINTYLDLKDAAKTAPLKTVYEALRSLGVDALVSIGGDDTLKTANKFARYQREQLPAGSQRIRVIHIPKTIDNDYDGIDFTFGYFTAVDTIAGEIQNLLADSESTNSYYLAEAMGRYAGWLAYGAAIAGEASLVLAVEDVTEKSENMLVEETYTDETTGKPITHTVVDMTKLVDRILDTMFVREKEGKAFGVIVLAEGLAEYLPVSYTKGVKRDEHGHLTIADVNFAKLFSKHLAKSYRERTGRDKKITGVTLGYESRCAIPTAFDVLLGSALGVGAYRAVVERGLDEVMVSTVGQLDLQFVPFEKLIDRETMKTRTRYIQYGSDFHRLARFLETHVVR